MRLHEIQLRDPFVLGVQSEGCYYLYGTTDRDPWNGPFVGFDCYRSRDLETWEGPLSAFRPPPDFWASGNFWAPEVREFKGAFWMTATFSTTNERRGTQILRANTPAGPFVPWSPEPVTPRQWLALDGTLWQENGKWWMIFCHEWLQIHDGEICAMPLHADFKSAAAPPISLFRASQAQWVRVSGTTKDGQLQFVTDGPFLHRTQSGALLLLWSSYGEAGYAIGLARSESGTVFGPWTQDPIPLWAHDGGHGMIFRDFAGSLWLVFHAPNITPHERPVFRKIKEQGAQLLLDEAENESVINL